MIGTTSLCWVCSFLADPPQAAALFGIAVGTGLNFVASRYLVFRSTHVRPSALTEQIRGQI